MENYEGLRRIDSKEHKVLIDGRQRITVSGVEDVDSFNENEVIFLTSMGMITVLGEDLHNDEDKRAVTVLTDDERPVVFYGETKNDPPATAVKSCRLPPSDKE